MTTYIFAPKGFYGAKFPFPLYSTDEWDIVAVYGTVPIPTPYDAIVFGDVKLGEGFPVYVPPKMAEALGGDAENGVVYVPNPAMATVLSAVAYRTPIAVLTAEIGMADYTDPRSTAPENPTLWLGSPEDTVLKFRVVDPYPEAGLWEMVVAMDGEIYRVWASVAEDPVLDIDTGFLWDGSRWWGCRLLPYDLFGDDTHTPT